MGRNSATYVKFDTEKARTILSKSGERADRISIAIGRSHGWLDNALYRGTMDTADMERIKRVYNLDITTTIINPVTDEVFEKQTTETEPAEYAGSIETIRKALIESSNTQSKQSAINTASVIESIDKLTDAIKELSNHLDANFDNQYRVLDTMRMKLDKIKK